MRLVKSMSKESDVPSNKEVESPARKLFYAILDSHWDVQKRTIGQVLTIIDASIQDQEQRKALKSVIEQMIYKDNVGDVDTIKDILSQFFNKFAPTLRDQDKNTFWDSEMPRCSENYFPDKN